MKAGFSGARLLGTSFSFELPLVIARDVRLLSLEKSWFLGAWSIVEQERFRRAAWLLSSQGSCELFKMESFRRGHLVTW